MFENKLSSLEQYVENTQDEKNTLTEKVEELIKDHEEQMS